MGNRKSSGGLMQIVFSMCILVLLSLLMGNVTLLLMAINLNNAVCQRAAHAGAEAYACGGDLGDLQTAASYIVNNETAGGFFIGHPRLAEVKSYTDTENGQRRRMLLVKTITGVYLPAPFLMLFASPGQEGRLLLSSICTIKLKHSQVSSRRVNIHACLKI